MKDTNCYISIVIPTYNRPSLLKNLFDSILEQTYPFYEVIVVNDASEPREYAALIEEYKSKFKYLTYLINDTNRGAPYSRNSGILKSKYSWIALVDDDDEWLPQKLEKQVHLINQLKDEKVGLVYTWTEARGQKGQTSYNSCISVNGDARKDILTTNFIMSASVIVKKQAICKAGLFNENFPSCQDWDMWTRIFLNGYEVRVVPEILTIYNRHGNESIGLSSNALTGYMLFLKQHWKQILLHTSTINILKKAALYLKIRIKLLAQ